MEFKFSWILFCYTVHIVFALKEEKSDVTENDKVEVKIDYKPNIAEDDVVVQEPFIKLALELFKTLPKPFDKNKPESLKAGLKEDEDTTNEKVRFRPKTTYSSHFLPHSQVSFVWIS